MRASLPTATLTPTSFDIASTNQTTHQVMTHSSFSAVQPVGSKTLRLVSVADQICLKVRLPLPSLSCLRQLVPGVGFAAFFRTVFRSRSLACTNSSCPVNHSTRPRRAACRR